VKIPLKKLQNLNLEKIKKELQKNNACYVLITCSKPSKEGKMQVELNYSGDEDLAAYLIDGAKSIFERNFHKVKNNF
jgi:hypothetical protein